MKVISFLLMVSNNLFSAMLICDLDPRFKSAKICGKKLNDMTENEISYEIRGCIFNVYNNLGPGLLESVYEAALGYELSKKCLYYSVQVGLPMIYEDLRLDTGYRMDILVENKVIVEIKSVENLLEVHHKQLLTYLKLSGLKLGLLVNFNSNNISKSVFRKVNGL